MLLVIPFVQAEEGEKKAAEPEKKSPPPSRIYPALYSRPAGQGPGIPARLIGGPYRSSYSSSYRPSPYRYRYDYGRPNYYSNSIQTDFGNPGSWYEPRSYDYTSRYPFSSTQVPAYRYPFARDYYSYGPGYSNYGYAFGYPYYGGFGGWYPGWYGGFGYWGYGGFWAGPWTPYVYY